MNEAQRARNDGCVLLLMKASSYRAEDFFEAAARLEIVVVPVVDTPELLAQPRPNRLETEFANADAAVADIVAYAEKHPVAAVLAVDDSGSLLAARASAVLGLPHNDPEAARAARDKYQMRHRLREAGVRAPVFRRFTTADAPAMIATQVDFPVVVKPLQLSGSQGVIRANDPVELGAAVQRVARLLHHLYGHDRAHPFLVEQYIPGTEVALEGMMEGERMHVLALFDKPDPLEGPYFEETIYVTPSRLAPATQEAIVACAAQAAVALGLRRGPVHAELRVNEEGPWLLEVAGRSIGGLCARTLRFGVSTSLEELILRQVVDDDIGTYKREEAARGVMMIPIPEGGLLRDYRGVEAAESVPFIDEVTITAPLNHTLTPLPEGDSYLGFIFARADTSARVEAALRAAHAKLQFDVEPVISLSVR